MAWLNSVGLRAETLYCIVKTVAASAHTGEFAGATWAELVEEKLNNRHVFADLVHSGMRFLRFWQVVALVVMLGACCRFVSAAACLWHFYQSARIDLQRLRKSRRRWMVALVAPQQQRPWDSVRTVGHVAFGRAEAVGKMRTALDDGVLDHTEAPIGASVEDAMDRSAECGSHSEPPANACRQQRAGAKRTRGSAEAENRAASDARACKAQRVTDPEAPPALWKGWRAARAAEQTGYMMAPRTAGKLGAVSLVFAASTDGWREVLEASAQSKRQASSAEGSGVSEAALNAAAPGQPGTGLYATAQILELCCLHLWQGKGGAESVGAYILEAVEKCVAPLQLWKLLAAPLAAAACQAHFGVMRGYLGALLERLRGACREPLGLEDRPGGGGVRAEGAGAQASTREVENSDSAAREYHEVWIRIQHLLCLGGRVEAYTIAALASLGVWERYMQ
ncbi:hypothetical protein CYMTET_55776 [Cymbomonas tetramitiformis]|uniref:Uncharacterized protein n=1 Tax=Cymbomonas tetramitiformis TaxID=36881 RepID=A0AAE0BDF1_9CHLO|nr:hypothetical protein CYMTET_55776 [Cymbomonas tetramitiformis]